MARFVSLLCSTFLCLFSAGASGADLAQRLDALEKKVQEQQKTIDEQQKVIEQLRDEMGMQPLHRQYAGEGDHAEAESGSATVDETFFKKLNISLIVDTYAYVSTLTDRELENSSIPGFTTTGLEQREGFNLRAAELIFFAQMNPHITLYANLPATEDGIEVEEAYAATTSLSKGLSIKGGKFKSNFSRLNSQHPHMWDFFDIPLPYRAFLGDEGLGGEKGVQVTWLPPLPLRSTVGVELLQGENDLLFGADARSGPHVLSVFAKSTVEPTEHSILHGGPSLLIGKARNANVTEGAELDGTSTLAGMEVAWKWEPAHQEQLILRSEYLYLIQNGILIGDSVTDVLRRRQDGFYIQGIYQRGVWRYGVRYDLLGFFPDRFQRGAIREEFGATPWRATGLVEYRLSETARIRLQYNHDRSDRHGRNNEEGILQFIFGIGAHTPHIF